MPDRTLTEAAPPRIEYREEPCKSALSRVEGMHFTWSLNPYMGCAHRCTFCYVRAFERRADRPSGQAYGRSIRVKTNIVAVLAAEVRRRSWRHEGVAIGSATDPYQPAEGRYRLTRGCIEVLGRSRTPFEVITRGPLVVRDIDVLADASARASVSVNLSVPTLDDQVWRNTEPGTAPPRQRLRAVRMLGTRASGQAWVWRPYFPGCPTARINCWRSCVPRATPVRHTCGRARSTCVRAPGSTSSRGWRGSGRRRPCGTHRCIAARTSTAG